MSSISDSETSLSQVQPRLPAVQSDANRIRQNDNSLQSVEIDDWDNNIENLDALKNNTAVKAHHFYHRNADTGESRSASKAV
jgi:hypothetical protein